MPVCPRCNIGYMPGEEHDCEPIPSAGRIVAGTVVGAVIGVPLVYLVLVLVLCTTLGGNLCGLPAVFIAPPVGIVGGGLVGARIARGRARSD